MFLKPTAKPTPRRTPSPRVVLPAPPGSRSGSRGSSSGRGGSSAAARRITSATGSEPSIRWPVGSTSPGASAFRSRSSTGSIPSATASLSICASPAKHVCTAPKPRIAPHGGTVHTDLLQREAEARRDLRTVDVQPLRGDVKVDPALAVRDREPGLGAEKRLILDPGLVDARHGDVAMHVGIAVANDDVANDVRAVVVAEAVTAGRALGMQVRPVG